MSRLEGDEFKTVQHFLILLIGKAQDQIVPSLCTWTADNLNSCMQLEASAPRVYEAWLRRENYGEWFDIIGKVSKPATLANRQMMIWL